MGVVTVEFRRPDASAAGKWVVPGATVGAETARPGRALGELVHAPAGRVRAGARRRAVSAAAAAVESAASNREYPS